MIGHGVKNRDRRLPRTVNQSNGIIHHRFHTSLCLLRRAVVIDIKQVKKEQPGFLVIELVNVHGIDLRSYPLAQSLLISTTTGLVAEMKNFPPVAVKIT